MPLSAGTPSGPIGLAAAVEPDLVDEIGLDEGRGDLRAALHHQPRDAARGELFQHRVQVETPVARGDGNDLGAAGRQHRDFGRLAAAFGEQPQRCGARRNARACSMAAGADAGRARRAPATASPCPAAGRSARDRRQSRCQRRSGSRRSARAAGEPLSATASPVIATGLCPAAPILSSADTASFSVTCGRPDCDAPDVSGMGVPRLVGAHADVDSDAGGTQPRVALPGDFGIGILDRADDARDTGGDQRIGARRRLAVVRARLERDVDGGAARGGVRRAPAPAARHAGGRRARSSRGRR